MYPIKFNNTYIGRVYLRSEKDGKDFIVDYVSKRSELLKHYINNNSISFNINVDKKTEKKIKSAVGKAGEIGGSIKKNE